MIRFKEILSIFAFVTLSLTYQSNAASYGSQSMTDPLLKVLVKRPDVAFAVEDPVKWHYTATPDLTIAQQEHDAFVEVMKNEGVEVFYHDTVYPELADAIYVHDPVVITDAGSVILRMGKELRRGEEDAIERKLQELGIPTLFKLTGDATAEGGDTLWVDKNTFAVGRSFRTNQEGFEQLKAGLAQIGVETIQVELPYWEGKESCLHLQSLISLIDEKVALVYPHYLPVSFVELLKERGFTLIEVPDEEFMTMGPNVLTISPGVCLTIEGNPITKQRLEEAGATVYTYKGSELSLRAEGGATCLTRPLLRVSNE